MARKPKNIILFLTDQQRKDGVGAYGNRIIRTPTLDRLAGEGTRFERAYTQNPFCCPARASILSGVYPRTHGIWHNGIELRTRMPFLGDLLQGHGYKTGSVGKIHVNPWFAAIPPFCPEETREYWIAHPEMKDWHGPYCGFQDVEMVLGHGDYSVKAGHYPAYLEKHFPEGIQLLQRASAVKDEGHLQCWHNAIPEEHHYNTWIADRTLEMIDRFADSPFFIHCSFPDPHHPFTACEPYASMYSPNDMPDPLAYNLEELDAMPPYYRRQHLGMPSYYDAKPPAFAEKVAGAPLKHIMAQTYGMITHVDASIGRVVAHLESKGLLEDTLLVFTSDHGELLGDHGFIFKGPFYYQSLINIPLIIRAPGGNGSVRRELVGHVDIVPTVLDSLGIEKASHLPGFSLKGHLEGKPDHVRDAVLTEFRPFNCPNMKVLSTDRWKLAYYHGETYGELFDLETDPEERRNLWALPEFQAMRDRLLKRLLDEMVATEAAWPPRGPWL